MHGVAVVKGRVRRIFLSLLSLSFLFSHFLSPLLTTLQSAFSSYSTQPWGSLFPNPVVTVLLLFPSSPKFAIPFCIKADFLSLHSEPLAAMPHELSFINPIPRLTLLDLHCTSLFLSNLPPWAGCHFPEWSFVPSDPSQTLPESSFFLCNTGLCVLLGGPACHPLYFHSLK